MFCPKCGKENDDDAQFCVHCGEKYAAATANSTMPTFLTGGKINFLTLIASVLAFIGMALPCIAVSEWMAAFSNAEKTSINMFMNPFAWLCIPLLIVCFILSFFDKNTAIMVIGIINLVIAFLGNILTLAGMNYDTQSYQMMYGEKPFHFGVGFYFMVIFSAAIIVGSIVRKKLKK